MPSIESQAQYINFIEELYDTKVHSDKRSTPEITNPFSGELQHIIGFENEYTLSLDTGIAYVCSDQDVLTGLMDIAGKISIYCKSSGISEYKDIDNRRVPMYEIDAIIAEDDKTVIPIKGLVGVIEKELRHKGKSKYE